MYGEWQVMEDDADIVRVLGKHFVENQCEIAAERALEIRELDNCDWRICGTAGSAGALNQAFPEGLVFSTLSARMGGYHARCSR